MNPKKIAPTSLHECITHLDCEVYIHHKKNATVTQFHEPLAEGFDSQLERMAAYDKYNAQIAPITNLLAKLHMHQFVSLVQTDDQASMAIALNAGDGIVAKITDSSYIPKADEPLPGQLPPIHRFNIGAFVVEIFPWVNRHHITQMHVTKMATELAKYGLRFKAGDDRPDNIGTMPNGELVVLDGDALQPIPNSPISPEERKQKWDQWLEHVHTIFNPLYSYEFYNHEQALVGESPVFDEQFSPLIQKKKGAEITADASQHPSNLWQRLFPRSNGNSNRTPRM